MGKLLYLMDNDQKPSPSQLVTIKDLEEFRTKMLMDIKMILEGHLNKTNKRWLKSNEVRKMLGVSAGTLQTLRNNGKIPFAKMGGLTYYDAAEIDHLLTAQKREP
ncbi:helix-turn-helix domain-containing protein [Flavitalea sp. BT771]|uniref:helix-turn-helix domain-containing protein n=1 Tax=Flavitalea sp. BT771 TaxID=3063329 RepID=UPI0026E1966F|nr:helix-turn-helix domain-containing protein [Flavitalea sp. BT771]MDO6434808.1 helix-turn-helix domain-containing protein [Flavitalea sp. BT771]MDV6223708.1 helix-turn-helix domain-containing protein [Flavitalea sp. BT771]